MWFSLYIFFFSFKKKIVGWCLDKLSKQEESMKDVHQSLIENEMINKELKCNLEKMVQKVHGNTWFT